MTPPAAARTSIDEALTYLADEPAVWVRDAAVAEETVVLNARLPSLDDIAALVRTESDGDAESESRGLEAFREEFSTLMASEDLGHVRRVVVLVDDLDRCLPDTVVETLETICLFLAVPKMAFVIAADEQRVAEAIRRRYSGGSGEYPEEPAKPYLHKIVQTTIPLPSLSRFDTEAYLLLLLNRPGSDGGSGYWFPTPAGSGCGAA